MDRKKDLIITGGENVSPVEVENFFMDHPAIQDVAVIGVPDPKFGDQQVSKFINMIIFNRHISKPMNAVNKIGCTVIDSIKFIVYFNFAILP